MVATIAAAIPGIGLTPLGPVLPFGIKIIPFIGEGLSTDYAALSGLYIDIFAPITTVAIGALFIQYVGLPLLEFTAFTVILPVAITMRSLGFLGPKLRSAANAVLAIAIAAYLLYPLTVAFDAYAINYIFSAANPLYGCTNCLSSIYVINPITPTQFSTIFGTTSTTGLFTVNPNSVTSFLTSVLPLSFLESALPSTVVSQVLTTTSNMAVFLFESVFMFGINLAITIGFAIGLAKGLDNGLEGVPNLWSGI